MCKNIDGLCSFSSSECFHYIYISDQLKDLVAIKPVEQFAEDVEPMEENTENQKLGQKSRHLSTLEKLTPKVRPVAQEEVLVQKFWLKQSNKIRHQLEGCDLIV